MSNIYDQHKAAFANVSAFVVLHNNERVATVAIKFPRDGSGRLYAYVHWFGTEMVRGYASGGGYDKRTAACSVASRKMPDGIYEGRMTYDIGRYNAFRKALAQDSGHDWTRVLEDAGFTVLQAV